MRRRDFNKRIDIYEITKYSDGYGGYKTTTNFITSTWAKVDPNPPGQYSAEAGAVKAFRDVKFTIRKRQDLELKVGEHFVLYRGIPYTITNPPFEVGFDNNFVEYYGVQTDIAITSDTTFYEDNFYDSGFYVGAE